MKRLTYIIAVILAFGLTVPASAVTDKEMEQARVIATQTYLRYANDASGYLDDLHPKTMSELEKGLKPKEKENLKAFKAIAVPKDYKSWDKAKLADFWANAFSTKGLIEKGRIGKSRAKKRINAMTIAAPAPEVPAKPAETETPAPTATAETPSTDATAAPATAPADSVAPSADEQALLALEGESEETIDKAENHTWIYIIILIILVGVVVALVVFASNVMKKSDPRMLRREEDAAPVAAARGEEANDMREKFAAKLSEKNNEVHSLNKKVEALGSENAQLKKNLESLTAETSSLRTRLSESSKKITELERELAAERNRQYQPQAAPVHPQPQAAPAPQPAQPKAEKAGNLRTIYLGRANAKGIFVRADRSLNVGNSVYRLDTSDGYAGTFRVAADPTVWELALMNPRESLGNACTAADIDATEGMSKVINDSAGTAIFEGGTWKVIRKAKIHYE